MGRTPKANYSRLMIDVAVRKLLSGDEVKVQDIANELKVSTALVHFYFKERQDLVAAAWREIFLSFVVDDQKKIDEFAPGKNWQGVADLVREIFSVDRDEVHQAHFRGLYEALRNPKFMKIAQEVQAETVQSWVELMQKSADQGVVTLRVDPEIIALVITAVPLGISAVQPELSAADREKLSLLWVNMLRAVLDPTEGVWIDFD